MTTSQVLSLFAIAFAVLGISALAAGSKGKALLFFVLAVLCWGASIGVPL